MQRLIHSIASISKTISFLSCACCLVEVCGGVCDLKRNGKIPIVLPDLG
jgi:hypothetical protein